MLLKVEIEKARLKSYEAWNCHDMDEVMSLFHDDIIYISWNGKQVNGKKSLRRAWRSWFNNHSGFKFCEEETFVDKTLQKALFRWLLEWPSKIPGYEGMPGIRKGVEVRHFHEDKIIKKLTYVQSIMSINNKITIK